MRLWLQLTYARCWFDHARLPCCWCRHDRNRIHALLAGAPIRLAREPAEAGRAVAAHARRLFRCASRHPGTPPR